MEVATAKDKELREKAAQEKRRWLQMTDAAAEGMAQFAAASAEAGAEAVPAKQGMQQTRARGRQVREGGATGRLGKRSERRIEKR